RVLAPLLFGRRAAVIHLFAATVPAASRPRFLVGGLMPLDPKVDQPLHVPGVHPAIATVAVAPCLQLPPKLGLRYARHPLPPSGVVVLDAFGFESLEERL